MDAPSPQTPQFGHHTLFKRLQSLKLADNPVVRKGQELAEDIRDRYETSDNPMVHKVEVRGGFDRG
jgi:hypothetical protein